MWRASVRVQAVDNKTFKIRLFLKTMKERIFKMKVFKYLNRADALMAAFHPITKKIQEERIRYVIRKLTRPWGIRYLWKFTDMWS